jgi:DNA-directed RNA polymerase delta subunit
MAPPSAEDLKKMMKDGRLVNIGENEWRLLAMGPILENHHLVEVENNIWKQVHETDQKFIVRRATERLEQIYPSVWRLVK